MCIRRERVRARDTHDNEWRVINTESIERLGWSGCARASLACDTRAICIRTARGVSENVERLGRGGELHEQRLVDEPLQRPRAVLDRRHRLA